MAGPIRSITNDYSPSVVITWRLSVKMLQIVVCVFKFTLYASASNRVHWHLVDGDKNGQLREDHDESLMSRIRERDY